MGRCWWCVNEATRLCDRVIGFHRRHNGTIILDEGFTCDAEMCCGHTRSVGHVSGEEPDTIDRCPFHSADDREGLGSYLESGAECEALRRRIKAYAARSQFKTVHGGEE